MSKNTIFNILVHKGRFGLEIDRIKNAAKTFYKMDKKFMKSLKNLYQFPTFLEKIRNIINIYRQKNVINIIRRKKYAI